MKPFSELTDAEVAEFIAGKMGWTKGYNHWQNKEGERTGFQIGNVWIGAVLWNPMNSLDQCWIFEEWLLKQLERPNIILLWHVYVGKIAIITPKNLGLFPMIHAAASQRCEAFYVTMGGIEG